MDHNRVTTRSSPSLEEDRGEARQRVRLRGEATLVRSAEDNTMGSVAEALHDVTIGTRGESQYEIAQF